MYGGGGGGDSRQPSSNGGEFLLSLLQRPSQQQQQQQQQSQLQSPFPHQQLQQQQQPPPPPQQLQPLPLDPAVAAVGPSIPFSQHHHHHHHHHHQVPPQSWQANGRDLLSSSPPPWPHTLSPPVPPGFPGLPHNQFHGNNLTPPNQQPQQQQQQQRISADDLLRLGFSSNSSTIHNLVQHKQVLEQKLQFGSISGDLTASAGLLPKERESRNSTGLERNLRQFDPPSNSNSNSNSRTFDGRRMPPPGFSNTPRGGGGGGGVGGGGGNWDYGNRRRELEHNVNREKGNYDGLRDWNFSGKERERLRGSNGSLGLGLTGQLDRPGPPAGSSNLHSASGSDVEESMMKLSVAELVENGEEDDHELDDILEADDKREKKSKKEFRSDNRGKKTLSQRQRMHKRLIQCRRDINRLNATFLGIYESLIPLQEEKAKQKQLLALLEKLVKEEWPKAQLYLYGSCANSFGVSKSDIDVCLAMEDAGIDKSEVLLKLADILQSDNLQNVQALTRARVPIVKLMDPVTGISCDICINNVLAVVNTKLLRDYAQVDVRLRQLAFIVKHWAKSRGVNETYQGTLSSYAYVLMCIHFLQLRHPAILPCLQKMEPTYSVTVDDIHCAFYDRIETLRGFGSPNTETISELVWAFFNYWAYCHDYANDVISVRTGSLISKREKDWTRRIGNDRHLICIEDPFEISHDLGRVVDKKSIKVLREEFERAAYILQNDPNPCVSLFEPYVPG